MKIVSLGKLLKLCKLYFYIGKVREYDWIFKDTFHLSHNKLFNSNKLAMALVYKKLFSKVAINITLSTFYSGSKILVYDAPKYFLQNL